MFEDIKRNKVKTGFIVSLFLVMVTFLIYYICTSLELGAASIIIAMAFSIITTIATYYNCDKIVLASTHARQATPEEHKKLINILEGLQISAGLSKVPGLYVVDDSQPNAFATGRNPEHAIICVTTGLLEKLEYYELEGVVAHELAHVQNYDIRLSAIVSVMVGFIVMISDFYLRNFLYKRKGKSEDKTGSLIAILGILFLILSPIFSKLLQLAVSRRREFLADATAVQYTRNPDGLISALIKISEDPNELKTATNATAHMYIYEPFRKNAKKKSDETSMFSTHPSIQARIEAIKNIQ